MSAAWPCDVIEYTTCANLRAARRLVDHDARVWEGCTCTCTCANLRAAQRLVDHDARVGEGTALALGPGAKKEGALQVHVHVPQMQSHPCTAMHVDDGALLTMEAPR